MKRGLCSFYSATVLLMVLTAQSAYGQDYASLPGNVCFPVIPCGQPCSGSNRFCDSNSHCVGGVCTRRRDAVQGDPCQADAACNACPSNLQCTNDTCQPHPQGGDSCSLTDPCSSGFKCCNVGGLKCVPNTGNWNGPGLGEGCHPKYWPCGCGFSCRSHGSFYRCM